MTPSKPLEPIRPCSTCGKQPAAGVQVGGVAVLGWLECRTCRKKTRDGQTFEQARREWNQDLA